MSSPPLPPPPPHTVTLHALSAGHFTLPCHQFIAPCSPTERLTVPSLSFLIQHTNNQTGKQTNILFDLGLRGALEKYPEPIRKHIENRRPITSRPDVVDSLEKGGLQPNDIDYVIFSHVHWDHIGHPSLFPSSIFIVGAGSLSLLAGTSGTSYRGGHSHFEADLLPTGRTIELSDPAAHSSSSSTQIQRQSHPSHSALNLSPWLPHPSLPLPYTLDLFADGSVYIVHAPGHLPGHINLLVRTSPSLQQQHTYLAGDAFHDRRLLSGAKSIGTWMDGEGAVCCIHADRAAAEETIERIRRLEGECDVEVVAAHDVAWEEGNGGRFLGAG